MSWRPATRKSPPSSTMSPICPPVSPVPMMTTVETVVAAFGSEICSAGWDTECCSMGRFATEQTFRPVEKKEKEDRGHN